MAAAVWYILSERSFLYELDRRGVYPRKDYLDQDLDAGLRARVLRRIDQNEIMSLGVLYDFPILLSFE